MKSNSKIENQLKKKNNPLLVETIILAKNNYAWKEVASILTSPKRNKKEFNLSELDKINEEIVIVCGKLLSQGEITKKKRVVALGFSEKTKEKLLKAGCEIKLISEEIQKNKEAKGIKILK